MRLPADPARAFWPALAALVGLGLAVRLLYGFSLEEPSGDAAFYHQVANGLADGEGFTNPFLGGPTAAHPPLFPALLAIVSLVGATGVDAHQAAGCVLGAVSVGVIGLAGRRLGGPVLGLAGAAVAAVYLPLVANDSLMMSESAYGLAIGLVLLAGVRLATQPSPRAAFILGLAVGVATLGRAEALLLLGLVALPLALRAPARGSAVALALLGAALVVAPWSARNLIEFDRLVLVSTNDGSVLSGANCDRTYGAALGSWDLSCSIRAGASDPAEARVEQRALEEALARGSVSQATLALLRSRNEAEVAARQRSAGLRYARDHAGELPKVVAARVARTWSVYRVREQVRLNRFFRGAPAWLEWLTVASFALVALAAARGGWALRRRRPELLVLLAPLVLVTLASAAGFGTPRFRHAAEVALVLLAAFGVAGLRRRPAPGTPPPGGSG